MKGQFACFQDISHLKFGGKRLSPRFFIHLAKIQKTREANLVNIICIHYFIGGAVPAELGEQDGKNAAASTVGLVNGLCSYI